MGSSFIQLLVLGGIVLFLVLRLRNVLGTRDGFEKPRVSPGTGERIGKARPELEVIEGGVDHDIADHVDIESATAKAIKEMKRAEPGFSLTEFLNGARGAYEMLLVAFESGDLETLRQFLSDDAYTSFADVIESRQAEGLHVDATFIGVREMKVTNGEYDATSQEGAITIRFIGELTSVVRDQAGEIIEGHPDEIKRQKDVWTFARKMGSRDPNWLLVATGG